MKGDSSPYCTSLQQLGSVSVDYMSSKRASQDCSIRMCFSGSHEASFPPMSCFLRGSFCEVWIKRAGTSSPLENKGFANLLLGVLLVTSLERCLSGKLHPALLFLHIPALFLWVLSFSLFLCWNIQPRMNCVDCFCETPRPCMYTAELQWEKIENSLLLGQ